MDADTLLYRQIHPSFIQNNRVTSAAFRPTPKDQKKLSTYDGSKISAQGAWQHFTQQQHSSAGVLGITVAECTDLNLEVQEDYQTHPYHVLVDFTGKTNSEQKKTAEQLKEKALARNWCYRSETS